ncbi:MAG: UDP-N-acetylglucosamine--N-acetylmuramyl-(pentapeptide) pyrophosphoryl-undecaprenol N-acetylglucosamine transferase [Phycisphaerales bacterium]|nr:UDP-N-acetylglucosamine--N-acetylmuramyl-(pentapeptide) pyrophosphoryl-undecaprenol N-acetylglucosamine transferase [Phycisphaerales bacterium]
MMTAVLSMSNGGIPAETVPTKGLSRRSPTIVLAGGGTGGHISPGLAIAERLRALDAGARIVFACSARKIDSVMLTEAAAEHGAIHAEGFSPSPGKFIRFVAGLARGRADARRLIESVRPDWIVSLGGFVTPPVVVAARKRGIPVLLVNLDATPGRANRWVRKRATLTVSAVPVPSIMGFAAAVIGMPIRSIALAPASQELCRAELGLDPTVPVLLITGASQGSQSLNDLAIALARGRSEEFKAWQVLHLCGGTPAGGIARYERAWREAGVRAAVLPFLHRMGVAWGAAEVALSRAGASSVAEVQANRVPTVFAPYPYHRDLHQRENAMPLVQAQAALMESDRVDPVRNLTGLGARVLELMRSGERRHLMRQALAVLPPPDSAEQIAEFLVHGRSFHSQVVPA